MERNNEAIGYVSGELCNRDNCCGIIDQHEKESGCSCHINPPCGSCTKNLEFCPVCGWNADEEQREMEAACQPTEEQKKCWEDQRKKRKEADDIFNEMFAGKRPVDKIDFRREGHTHFSMKVRGVFPAGTTQAEVLKEVRGTFGGRFDQWGKQSFIYIAYTD